MRFSPHLNNRNGDSLRYGIIIPLALMVTAFVLSYSSYSYTKQNIKTDLNEAIIALANKNSDLWTHQDTIAALRQIHEKTHKPLIFQASDIDFRYNSIKDDTYFTLALIDKNNLSFKIQGDKIVSDSIMLLPENEIDGIAIHVQGFTDCSMSSIFTASDQALPGVLFSISLLSMASMFMWRRNNVELSEEVLHIAARQSLDKIKLTPMQRQFTRMLISAPDMKVDKATICATLWGNKSNAEESLYTLVRRTKVALADADIEIICNRGESYELRINS